MHRLPGQGRRRTGLDVTDEVNPTYTLTIPMIVTGLTMDEATKLAELAAGNTVLELGAKYGFTTVVMAQAATLVCSVDWHRGDEHSGYADSWDRYRRNLEFYGVADKVDARRGRFKKVLPALAEEGMVFDGCFLDGHHTATAAQTDLELALPLIRKGGFIAFHDYGRDESTGNPGFGVTEVADRFGVDGVVNHLAWGTVE